MNYISIQFDFFIIYKQKKSDLFEAIKKKKNI